MSLTSVAGRWAAFSVFVASVGVPLLLVVGSAGCSSSSSAPEADKDFCGAAASASKTCEEPTDCDAQLASDCKSLKAALSPASMAAARDCLESGICGVASCVSRSANGAAPTATHKTLAEDFCSSCAPNITDCVAGFYKRGAAGSVALPYADAVVQAVDDQCTGTPGCQAKFTQCARDAIAAAVGDALDPATADCVTQGFSSDDTSTNVGPDGKPQVVTCTPANCAGCCRDDRCESGDSSDACGTGAAACQTCATTSTCTDGACKEPCGPNTCKGCCDGDTCVEGTASETCGSDGEACTTCDGGFACSNHTCVDASCQATCVSGCCSATGCEPGTAADNCGAGGEACIDCGVGRSCVSASCQLEPTSLWDVYISFAVVPEKSHSNLPWDALGGAPDPYVKVFTSQDASVHSGQTSAQSDTFVPFWAETPVLGVTASELLANTSIEIWDSDSLDADDYIGGCALNLTPDIFDGSLQDHVCPATASTVSVEIYFRINPHES